MSFAFPTSIENEKVFYSVLRSTRINSDELLELGKWGIPERVRAPLWQYYTTCLPLDLANVYDTKQKARQRYTDFIKHFFDPSYQAFLMQEKKRVELARLLELQQEQLQQTFSPVKLDPNDPEYYSAQLRSIEMDIVRTHPNGCEALFKNKTLHMSLRRIVLYVSHILPGGYFQGLIDLAVPFLLVFIHSMLQGDVDVNRIEQISKKYLLELETDVCTSLVFLVKSLTISKENRVFSEEICEFLSQFLSSYDSALSNHLSTQGLSAIHIVFRWITCLFTREFNGQQLIVLWDYILHECAVQHFKTKADQTDIGNGSIAVISIATALLKLSSEYLLQFNVDGVMEFVQQTLPRHLATLSPHSSPQVEEAGPYALTLLQPQLGKNPESVLIAHAQSVSEEIKKWIEHKQNHESPQIERPFLSQVTLYM